MYIILIKEKGNFLKCLGCLTNKGKIVHFESSEEASTQIIDLMIESSNSSSLDYQVVELSSI